MTLKNLWEGIYHVRGFSSFARECVFRPKPSRKAKKIEQADGQAGGQAGMHAIPAGGQEGKQLGGQARGEAARWAGKRGSS